MGVATWRTVGTRTKAKGDEIASRDRDIDPTRTSSTN